MKSDSEKSWEEVAKEGNLTDSVYSIVAQYQHVTFVELQSKLKDYFTTRGDIAMETAPNAILWFGMSQELCDAINELIEAKKIFPHPASQVTYMVDGAVPKMPMPMAKSKPPVKGSVKPRWIPICFCTSTYKAK